MHCSTPVPAQTRTLRVGVYARHLPPTHRAALEKLVDVAFPKMEIINYEMFLDPEASGFGPPGPALGRLLSTASRGELDVVLVDNPIQFGVSTERRQQIMLALTMQRVHVLTPSDLALIARQMP